MTINNERLLKENIQKNLVFYRKRMKLTQKDLASEIGCTAAAISSWECGNNSPDIDTLVLICNVLEVGLYEMCGISSDNSSMTSDENKLLNTFRSLNDEGKEELLKRADELCVLGYIKVTDARMA